MQQRGQPRWSSHQASRHATRATEVLAHAPRGTAADPEVLQQQPHLYRVSASSAGEALSSSTASTSTCTKKQGEGGGQAQ